MPTGIEEAGIVIAAVSITFQTFSGCIQGFQLLSSAHHFGKDAELLVCMLKLEEYKLILWSKKSGLIDDELDPRLNVQIVNAALGEIRQLFEDTGTLKKRYHLELKDEEAKQLLHQTSNAAPSTETLRFLDNDSIIQEQERIFARAKLEQKKTSFPKRLWWAAVDRKGMEELITYVGGLVQRLFDIVTVLDSEDIKQQLNLLHLKLVTVAETVEGIRLVQNMVAGTTESDETLTTVAALKALSIDPTAKHDASTQIHIPAVKRRLLTKVESFGTGHTATALYENIPVILELKKYAETDISGPNAVTISTRVQSLTALLNAPKPPSFRTLHCIGMTPDSLNLEYQFVFDRPLHSKSNTPPRSLLSLLRSSFIPSLTARFRLAADLATTLLHLHASGWLHKGFRAENILFFPPTPDAPRTLDEPYIMGYEYARHDKPGEISFKPSEDPTQDIYRHPRAQGPVSGTFTKAFDVYALGITLVEIAYWRSFADILEKMGVKMKDVSPEMMQKVRDRLVDEDGKDQISQNLRFKMGDEYAKVVLCCLGTVFEDVNLAAEDFLTTYFELVVRRLQKLAV